MITRNLKPRSGRNCCDSNKDNAARTHKKLPVASFCASETAETGRIANGREQGDHVSRRQGGKGFNFVSAKLWFCALIRGSQNLGAPCEGVRLVTFCIVQKVTKKHTGLRPATSIQSSAGNTFREAFQRHVPKPIFRTKRRRKGFESVRCSGVTA